MHTLNLQGKLIERFLCDVRDHFRASLETSEYENTSNLFYVTEAETTIKLLQRCESILEVYKLNNTGESELQTRQKPLTLDEKLNRMQMKNENNYDSDSTKGSTDYLDMTGNSKGLIDSMDYIDCNISPDSHKTFRCKRLLEAKCQQRSNTIQTNANDQSISKEIYDDELGYERCSTVAKGYDDDYENENDDGDHIESDRFRDDCQTYDTCQVGSLDIGAVADDEPVNVSTHTHSDNCPYDELPASHLITKKSTKLGQLHRIEKRLFFDHCKKYYCGILNGWLLCYTDGLTSARPILTIHLCTPSVEIEHAGEGKRRDICFQITTGCDPSKRFVFQAINEVDAKEWIHAIETAIHYDSTQSSMNNHGSLLIPPLTRQTPIGNNAENNIAKQSADRIYEEPSTVYKTELVTIQTQSNNGRLKESQGLCVNDSIDKNYNYDVPKLPVVPLIYKDLHPQRNCQHNKSGETNSPTESERVKLLVLDDVPASTSSSPTEIPYHNTDFQAKVKDLHSKLASQLSVGPPKKIILKKTHTNSEDLSLTLSSTLSIAKEIKKHKKSSPTESCFCLSLINKQDTENSISNECSPEKSSKNWFLSRLSKSSSSFRNASAGHVASGRATNKGRVSENENLLYSTEDIDKIDGSATSNTNTNKKAVDVDRCNGAPPDSKKQQESLINDCPSNAKSKINLIISKFETPGTHMAMLGMEALTRNSLYNLNASFREYDSNNYEPVISK